MIPVVGGVTLACLGAAAAAAATTRADEAGEAARASGRAVAAGWEKVSSVDVAGNAREIYRNKFSSSSSSSADAKKEEPSHWWSALYTPRVSRLEVYGKSKTSVKVAEGFLSEIGDGATPDKRRRVALEIIREVHPDRAGVSVSSKATATALTRVAVVVRDYLDEVGWDAFDNRSKASILADVKKRITE